MRGLRAALTGACLGAMVLGSGAVGCAEEDDEHAGGPYGSVRIDLQDDDAKTDPFEGTKSIIIKLHYNECLTSFYRDRHPELSLDDKDGQVVFEEWESRVCASDDLSDPWDAGYIDCTFEEGTWEQEVDASADESYLRYRISVNDDDMSGRYMRVGPIPRESLTTCQPLMKLQNNSVIGVDDDKRTVWRIAGYQDETQGPASGEAMRIDVVAKSDPSDNDDEDENEDG